MQKDLIRKGIIVVFVGVVVLLFGAMLSYGAYSSLIRYAEEPWSDTSLLAKAYEEARAADLASSMGFVIAFIGIAVVFYGIASEPVPTVMATQVQQPWQQAPPQQYPPQP